MKSAEGLWKLTPSSLYGYSECKSCFWVDNNYKKAPSLPWLLNSAMDSILKHRYDLYRAQNTFPPEVDKELKKQHVQPFLDIDKLTTWRSSTSALEYTNKEVGYILYGKIDDVMCEATGQLIPTDYKSSGWAPKEDKQKYYRDQLNAYGLMFTKNGYEVSDRAYLLHYYPVDTTDPAIEVKFTGHVDKVNLDISVLEQKLVEIVKLLNGPYPGHNDACPNCSYLKGRHESVNKNSL